VSGLQQLHLYCLILHYSCAEDNGRHAVRKGRNNEVETLLTVTWIVLFLIVIAALKLEAAFFPGQQHAFPIYTTKEKRHNC
jgi:hypothetical protein